MASFQYRAVTPAGGHADGRIEAESRAQALVRVRRLGVRPIELIEARTDGARPAPRRPDGRTRKAVNKTLGELAVLINAGLPLDRALALAIDNIEQARVRAAFDSLLEDVKRGIPLARAMGKAEGLFGSTAQAMTEAGEANGRLGDALARLAATLEGEEELRQLIGTSMIYPAMLIAIATGVILLMLLFVVPQFESVFATAQGTLPPASLAVMGASRALREYGWHILIALVTGGFAARQIAGRPNVRLSLDRLILRAPQLGMLVTHAQTAMFARIMAVLVDGGIALPDALNLARRSMSNTHMADAVGRVASGVREGGGLTAPLAAAGIFPKLALGFLRTGEETSQLGLMLGRLADVLDREVRIRLQRLIGVLTPAITVILGAAVAGIIAAVMTAILGFNDLAVAQ